MTTNEFKAKFRLYCNYLERKKKLEEEIDLLLYQLSGVKGINYEKAKATYNPELSNLKRLELIDKLEVKYIELNSIKVDYEFIDLIRKKFSFDEFTLLHRILIENEGYGDVGEEYGYSASGMWKVVDSLIKSVL